MHFKRDLFHTNNVLFLYSVFLSLRETWDFNTWHFSFVMSKRLLFYSSNFGTHYSTNHAVLHTHEYPSACKHPSWHRPLVRDRKRRGKWVVIYLCESRAWHYRTLLLLRSITIARLSVRLRLRNLPSARAIATLPDPQHNAAESTGIDCFLIGYIFLRSLSTARFGISPTPPRARPF